jgi:hypothetical protein
VWLQNPSFFDGHRTLVDDRVRALVLYLPNADTLFVKNSSSILFYTAGLLIFML